MIAPSKDSKLAKSKSATRNGRARAVFRGVAISVVALLAVAGGVAWWAFRGKGESSPADDRRKPPSMIVDVKPVTVSPPTTNAVAAPVRRERLEPGTKRHVEWKRPANWDQMTRAQKTRAQPVSRVIKPVGWGDRKLFTQPSDRKLERLMRIQPGRLVLGTLTYDEKFVSDFLESLKTPIEFTEDDSESDKAVKQAVKDARADLKAAYDRGEDIVEIMNATEKELHELAAYKLDLRKMLADYKKSGEHSEQEVKEYVNAANAMLAERGMEPLRLGEIWFRKSQCDATINGNREGETK